SDPITINDNPLEKNENNINQKSNVRPNPQETPMNPSNQYRERSLKEIYEDFWDFIDNDNEIFMEFIINDERRKFEF
ncbi:MAG: hypothetical protein R6W84_17140, partial [Promethearchaeia archaeon]